MKKISNKENKKENTNNSRRVWTICGYIFWQKKLEKLKNKLLDGKKSRKKKKVCVSNKCTNFYCEIIKNNVELVISSNIIKIVICYEKLTKFESCDINNIKK